MREEVVVLRPSTPLTLGLILSVVVPMLAIFGWIEATYVHQERYDIQYQYIQKSLDEIKRDLKTIRK